MERSSRMVLVLFLFFSRGLANVVEEWQWECKSGEKINKDFKCDSMVDCQDGSDETKDLCAVPCPEETFSCRNMAKCIDTELLCDDFDDCGDKSDEAPEICPGQVTTTLIQSTASPCPSSEFFCRDGSRCLPMKYVCDERPDCPDGSDEKFEMCCNSKLDIGNQTSPCDTDALPASIRKTPPEKCLTKKACSKKCKAFWDVLPQVLSDKTKKKLVRKCARNPTSKRCMKCRPLLLQLGMKTETKPKKKKGRRGKGRKNNRRKARRNEIL